MPTGTTGSIVVNWTGTNVGEIQIAVYALYNCGLTPTNTGTTPDSTVAPGSMVVTATVPASGFGIAVFAGDRSLSATFSNGTLDFTQTGPASNTIFAVHTATSGVQTPTSSSIITNYNAVMACWGP